VGHSEGILRAQYSAILGSLGLQRGIPKRLWRGRAEDTAENVKQEILDRGADLVLHMGDISYANGEVRIWDAFMRYIEPYASAAPYMIGVGNHEYDYRTGGEKHRKHRHHPDASGSDEPYDPDWGNYGAPLRPIVQFCHFFFLFELPSGDFDEAVMHAWERDA
jgi:hypothetical protein